MISYKQKQQGEDYLEKELGKDNVLRDRIVLGQFSIIKGFLDNIIMLKETDKDPLEFSNGGNVAIGSGGIGYNTVGVLFGRSVILGSGNCMHSTADVNNCTFVGYSAGKEYKGGGHNDSFGGDSGWGMEGFYNLSLGSFNAGSKGDRNTIIGNKLLQNAEKRIIGDDNLHIGYYKLGLDETISNSLRIGKQDFSLINGDFSAKTIQSNGQFSIAGNADDIDTIIFPTTPGVSGQQLQLDTDNKTLIWV